MTQADKIASDMSLPPLADPLYLFDVISSAPAADVKAAAAAVGSSALRHSFKVIGENRYIFAVASKNVTVGVLRQLTFPEGSTVTQYPMEHTSDYFRMFGVERGWEEPYETLQTVDDAISTMVEYEFIIAPNTPYADFNAKVAAFARLYEAAHASIKPASYVTVIRCPPKIIFFNIGKSIEDNPLQNLIKDGFDTLDGPGNVTIRFKHLVTI